jgi:D-alanine-D-alanine ligase-like ATP-grasp enzyme
VAAEIRATGREVQLACFRGVPPERPDALLLRLSDPVMLEAARILGTAGVPYRGPGAVALSRCYDKWNAYRVAAASGLDCPPTRLAEFADDLPRPLILKPRQGSDSIGVRLLREGAVPTRFRNERTLAQPQIVGTELTVGVINGVAGAPLQLLLRPGVPYTFLRKYLLRPGRAVLSDAALASRARAAALQAAAALGVDWAARVDFLHEHASGRLLFLECDAAPLVGPDSAFAASLVAAGMPRAEQLARLLGEDWKPATTGCAGAGRARRAASRRTG